MPDMHGVQGVFSEAFAAFAAFGSRVRHLHIHHANPEEAHLAIGSGILDFAAHADAIRALPHTMIMELIVDG